MNDFVRGFLFAEKLGTALEALDLLNADELKEEIAQREKTLPVLSATYGPDSGAVKSYEIIVIRMKLLLFIIEEFKKLPGVAEYAAAVKRFGEEQRKGAI